MTNSEILATSIGRYLSQGLCLLMLLSALQSDAACIAPDRVVLRPFYPGTVKASLAIELGHDTIRIPGTRVSMIAPSGFNSAKGMVGLIKDNDTFINVFDAGDGDHYMDTKTFTRDYFESSSNEVLAFDDTQIGGYAALYVWVRSLDDAAATHFLFFGDSTLSVIISAKHSGNNPEMDVAFQTAFRTVTYDRGVTLSPFDDLDFEVIDSQTVLKFAERTAGALTYTVDGAKDASSAEFLLVYPVPWIDSTLTHEGVLQRQLDGVIAKGFVVSSQRRSSSRKLNGYDSYSCRYEGVMLDMPMVLFLQIVSHEESAILFYGASTGDFDQALDSFKELIATVRFK